MGVEPVPPPPNRTTLSPSIAMAWPLRAPGPATCTEVHVEPWNAHVSARNAPAPEPPNSTTRSPSAAIAGHTRAPGPVAGACIHAAPSKVHVSTRVCEPPMSTTSAAPPVPPPPEPPLEVDAEPPLELDAGPPLAPGSPAQAGAGRGGRERKPAREVASPKPPVAPPRAPCANAAALPTIPPRAATSLRWDRGRTSAHPAGGDHAPQARALPLVRGHPQELLRRRDDPSSREFQFT